MSIWGIGIDIVDIRRIAKIDSKSDLSKFCKRILSANEYVAWLEHRKYNFVAKRFAAKEAFVKAIGTGYRDGIAFSEIEIIHDSLGKPEILLLGRTQELIATMLPFSFKIFLSISDEENYAVAYALIEKV